MQTKKIIQSSIKVNLLMLFFAVALVFSACEKEMPAYTGKEGVYFAVRHNNQSDLLPNLWPYQPYSEVNFVRLATDEVLFPVQVMITGPTKDYDRQFRVAVDRDSTTAIAEQHYAPLQDTWTIPAGAVSTTITVRISRTADLETTSANLGLQLLPTSDFDLSFPEWDAIPEYTAGTIVPHFDASKHTLRINDVMVQPAVWSGSLQPGNRESGLFGVFSRQKMEFLIENLGLTYEDFASLEVMPMARQILISNDGAAALIRRFNANDPVLENDGRLMWMGTVPWISYVGIPWRSTGN